MCTRELVWIRPGVARELERWRESAAAIPDPMIREVARAALSSKRFNAEGAALFAAIPPRRDPDLLRLLIAFQVLLDFLDSISEHPVADPQADGCQLHLALTDALDPNGPVSDYFRHHPRQDDGGYVRALVQTCRQSCLRLPTYGRIAALAHAGAERCGVQGLNHDLDAARRDRTLEGWARETIGTRWGLSWWELTAAASSSLGVHALLALAADPGCREQDAMGVDTAYMPWICALSTMLDSYVDEHEDAVRDVHSYIAHYPSEEIAEQRIHDLIGRALNEARQLRDGARHALVVAGMVAMYLSAEEARTCAKRDSSRAFVRTGGPITRMLVPIMRTWRVAYGLPHA